MKGGVENLSGDEDSSGSLDIEGGKRELEGIEN